MGFAQTAHSVFGFLLCCSATQPVYQINFTIANSCHKFRHLPILSKIPKNAMYAQFYIGQPYVKSDECLHLCYYDMMRHLGIDYGTKRIGVALSDEGGTMAFPHAILENTKKSVGQVKEICDRERVGIIVVGESLDYKGQPNLVKIEADKFIIEIQKATNLPVVEEREFLSTQQARFHQAEKEHVDDSAAAIILQSYLDRKNNRPILETL